MRDDVLTLVKHMLQCHLHLLGSVDVASLMNLAHQMYYSKIHKAAVYMNAGLLADED